MFPLNHASEFFGTGFAFYISVPFPVYDLAGYANAEILVGAEDIDYML